MAANPSNLSSAATAIELKSGSITLPILRILSPELDAIAGQLEQKIGKAPEFFRNAPIIVDLGELTDEQKNGLDLLEILEKIHKFELAPVGMRGGNADHQKLARQEKLAVLADVKTESAPEPIKNTTPKRAIPAPKAIVNLTKVIDQPVRSGQRIYATGGDLIVMAQVSPGAEIMADGNIHVYGSLKGRALAGVQGNKAARIFCTDLQAQLVAIGGNYRTSEDDDQGLKGKMVQIYLQDDTLKIDPL